MGETYYNKDKDYDIRPNVEKDFKKKYETITRDDRQIYQRWKEYVDQCIKDLTNATGVWVDKKIWTAYKWKPKRVSLPNEYKDEALKYFRQAKTQLDKDWKDCYDKHTTAKWCNWWYRIMDDNERAQVLNEVAATIDNYENKGLMAIKLNCNPKQENDNAADNSGVKRDKHWNVQMKNGEIERQKPLIEHNKKTGVTTFTDRANSSSVTLESILKSGELDDILVVRSNKWERFRFFEIDYSKCKSSSVKKQMLKFTWTSGKCMIRYDKEKKKYVARSEKDWEEQTNVPIYEWVSLKRAEIKQWEKYQKDEEKFNNAWKVDAPINSNVSPEQDPKLKNLANEIPTNLQKKLRNLGNVEYRKFIIENENRLNEILKQHVKRGYALQAEPVTKLRWSWGLMELHFITGTTKKNVTVWENDSKLWEKLYDLLGDNEDDFKDYLTKRANAKRTEFNGLKQKDVLIAWHEDFKNDYIVEKWKEMSPETYGKILYGMGCLERFMNNKKQSTWDAYITDKDQAIAWILDDISKLRDKLEFNQSSLEESVLREEIIKYYKKMAEKWSNYTGKAGKSRLETYEKKFYTIFFWSRKQQLAAIRRLDDDNSIMDKTDSSFVAEEMAALDDDAPESKLEVNNPKINEYLNSLTTFLYVNDVEYDANGEIKKTSNMLIIDRLYNAASDSTWDKIINVLVDENLIPSEWKNDGDLKEKAKDIAKKLKDQQENIDKKLSTSDMLSQMKNKLAEYENRLSNLSDAEQEDYQKLVALMNDPAEMNRICEFTLEQTKNNIKYVWLQNLFRQSLLPIYVDKWGGAKWEYADIYNDVVWYGRFNLSDDNAKVAWEILVEIAITVAVCVVTGWAWGALLGAALRCMAVAARAARWTNLAIKVWRAAEILNSSYKTLAVWEKALKLTMKWVSLLPEGVIFNAASDVVHSARKWTSLDGLNFDPTSKKNIQTAAFLWALSIGGRLTSFLIPGKITKLPIDFTVWLNKATVKYATAFTTWVVAEMWSMLAAEQAINITFWHDVYDPETWKFLRTEHGFAAPTQEELIQMVWMILAFKAVRPKVWEKIEKKLNEWTAQIWMTAKRDFIIYDKSAWTVQKLKDAVEGKDNTTKKVDNKWNDKWSDKWNDRWNNRKRRKNRWNAKTKDVKNEQDVSSKDAAPEVKTSENMKSFKGRMTREKIEGRKESHKQKIEKLEKWGREGFKKNFKELMDNFSEGLKDLDTIKKEMKKNKENLREAEKKRAMEEAKKKWTDFDEKDFNEKFDDRFEQMEREIVKDYTDMYKECCEKFKEYKKLCLETYERQMKEWDFRSAKEEQDFIIREYELLLENWPTELDWLIPLKSTKKTLKWQYWRELYNSLESILKRFENGEISDIEAEIKELSTSEDFSPEKLAEMLWFDKWQKWDYDTLKRAVDRVDHCLTEYYETVSEIYDPEVEALIKDNAIWAATMENWYYVKKWETREYAKESPEHKEQRMREEKAVEERAVQNGNITEELTNNLLNKINNDVINEGAKQQIRDLVKSLEDCCKDGWFSNKQVYDICKKCIEEVAYQTMESQTRTMWDHGINHVAWNIARFDSYLDSWVGRWLSLGEWITPAKWKLMWRIIQIFHDAWYAAFVSRGSGHFKWSDLHPFTSQTLFDAQVKPLLEKTGMFTPKDLELMSSSIWSHDGTTFNWNNPITTMTHIADNMAIWVDKFQSLMTNKKAAPYLLMLLRWKWDMAAWREQICKKIEGDTSIPKAEKDALISSINEFNDRSFSNFWFYSIEGWNEFVVGEGGKNNVLKYRETQYDWVSWLELEAKARWIEFWKWEGQFDLQWAIEEAKKWDIKNLYEMLKNKKLKWWGDQITKPWWDYGERYDIRANGKVIHEKGRKVDTNLVKAYLLAWYPIEFITTTGKVELRVEFERANSRVTEHSNNAYDVGGAANRVNEIIDNHFTKSDHWELNIGSACDAANNLKSDLTILKKCVEAKELPENPEKTKATIRRSLDALYNSITFLGNKGTNVLKKIDNMKKAIDANLLDIPLNDIKDLETSLDRELLPLLIEHYQF